MSSLQILAAGCHAHKHSSLVHLQQFRKSDTKVGMTSAISLHDHLALGATSSQATNGIDGHFASGIPAPCGCLGLLRPHFFFRGSQFCFTSSGTLSSTSFGNRGWITPCYPRENLRAQTSTLQEAVLVEVPMVSLFAGWLQPCSKPSSDFLPLALLTANTVSCLRGTDGVCSVCIRLPLVKA